MRERIVGNDERSTGSDTPMTEARITTDKAICTASSTSSSCVGSGTNKHSTRPTISAEG